ncbi:SDR family oxidoreductase [Chelativorans sp. YIM 93263]|uniref:SDR family oxidoreductase n=1 Tax=Chelativorans sp. YIM 93263 TaxID=2906648 RepID=UPI0023786257|nr:SDR family oxidoreductase [Chelativorans sp. YIM 93263]
MRIMVTGASGLIGSAICARLSEEGHEVVAVVRPGSGPVPSGVAAVVPVDVAQAVGVRVWLPHLRGIQAVVNCVGALQENPREHPERVHATGVATLFRACEQRGIRRVIHFSAIGVDREQPSAFSASKLRGDRLLMDRDLDWVILRPSVVLGRAVFGASALFRGLSALPLLPQMNQTGPLQVVTLDDVTATVAFFVQPSAPSQMTVELAGPERLSMSDVVTHYRRWLSWPPAKRFVLPDFLANLLYRAGDFAGWLGWRPPVRSTAQKEIRRGAIGDPEPWKEITGIEPSTLSGHLARDPASVQERWFAKLFFLKPVIFVVLSLFWLATGIISLTIGYTEGVELMLRAGTGPLAGPGVVAGALADILIGLAIARRSTSRAGLYGAIALALFYVVAGTILLPELWREPLGPLMKIWPILVLHFVGLAILEER